MSLQPIIITHPTCVKHETGYGHPERPERLIAIMDMIRHDMPHLQVVQAPLANDGQLALAHPQSYIDHIISSIPQGGTIHLDGDTVINHFSLEAARYAAGAACHAVDLVMGGKCQSAFAATRPPGHHAVVDKAMGFCLFANAYIAARYAQEKYKTGNVAIVDFDVHHGNGTAALVYHNMRPDILYVSTHQHPLYPGTGDPAVDGDAGGLILDIPLPAGTSSAVFRAAYTDVVIPALKNFKPDLLILSAGFDAHHDDPVGGMALDEEDFAWVTRELAATCPRVVSVLEGGYDITALVNSVRAHLEALGA